jgi:hypothetical protein
MADGDDEPRRGRPGDAPGQGFVREGLQFGLRVAQVVRVGRDHGGLRQQRVDHGQNGELRPAGSRERHGVLQRTL